jgi:Tol biopolymer transport system component
MKSLPAAVPAALLLAALCVVPAAPADAPKPLKPVNLAINTEADEDDPHPAGNGLALYYAANAKGKYDVMVARRDKVSVPWGKGEILQDYIQSEADDRSPFVTSEVRFPQFLYYASKLDKAGKNFDIYCAVKQGPTKAFAEPRALTMVDTEADELHPWLSADGKELYFSRKTKEGWRILVAKRASAAGPVGFGEPVLLEDLPADFHHATLMPDGRTMYLQGPLEKGRWGLFVATRSAKGWNTPEPLENLNDPAAPTGDRSPALTRDGQRLYFASDRDGGKGGLDLWVIETASLKKK